MRYSRRYIIFAGILVLAFILKVSYVSDTYGQVEQFRGAQLEEDVFYPLKAASINQENSLTAVVDDTPYTNAFSHLTLNSMMIVMGDAYFIGDVLGMSVIEDTDGKITVQRGEVKGAFFVGETEGNYAGGVVTLSAAPIELNGSCYLPVQDFCTMFGYGYAWDAENYVVSIQSPAEDEDMLPSVYDLRDINRVSEVRDQGSSTTCWAQAAAGAMESSLLPAESVLFSVDHMVTENSFGREDGSGGDYAMASAYLLAWQGPVTVADQKKDYHVQEVHYYTPEDTDAIKKAVFLHGGVTTSIYADVEGKNLSSSSYYNSSYDSYCYSGSNKANHEVIIIGWDDGYSASHFNGRVRTDGAWICQNSWGKDFGEEGVFYVSYADTVIGTQGVSYVGIESSDNYDSIYQSDLCGWTGQVGYNKDSILAANVYTADKTEQIAAAGFFATDKNTSYQVYFVHNADTVSSLSNRTLITEGVLEDKGYYTIRFASPETVAEGENFAILISITTPDSTQPMAIEYVSSSERTANVDISDGNGYISSNGIDWESAEAKVQGNLCLKVYARDIQEEEE